MTGARQSLQGGAAMLKRLVGVLVAALAPLAAVPASAVVEYYHLDALGSVRAVTDESGVVVERHDYLPFGEECVTGPCASNPAAGGGQPTKFTGKERDAETGLDYFQARYYSTKTARFTTQDPVHTWRENLEDPQRWNRYAYVRSNPLRHIDPDGRVIEEVADVGRQIVDGIRNAIWNNAADVANIVTGEFQPVGGPGGPLSPDQLRLPRLEGTTNVEIYTELVANVALTLVQPQLGGSRGGILLGANMNRVRPIATRLRLRTLNVKGQTRDELVQSSLRELDGALATNQPIYSLRGQHGWVGSGATEAEEALLMNRGFAPRFERWTRGANGQPEPVFQWVPRWGK